MQTTYKELEKLERVSNDPDLFLVVSSKNEYEQLKKEWEQWLKDIEELSIPLSKEPKVNKLVFNMLRHISRIVGKLEGSL